MKKIFALVVIFFGLSQAQEIIGRNQTVTVGFVYTQAAADWMRVDFGETSTEGNDG